MTEQETKAFWQGLAVTSNGKIQINSVVGNDVVNVDFNNNYKASITMADGTVYTITGVDVDNDGKITTIYIQDDIIKKYVTCTYDDNGYLIQVGTVVVGDVQDLGLTIDIKLQDKTVMPSSAEQTITFDTNYDGLNTVTISGDNHLIPENIVKGVSIFGVEGSYSIKDGNTMRF